MEAAAPLDMAKDAAEGLAPRHPSVSFFWFYTPFYPSLYPPFYPSEIWNREIYFLTLQSENINLFHFPNIIGFEEFHEVVILLLLLHLF